MTDKEIWPILIATVAAGGVFFLLKHKGMLPWREQPRALPSPQPVPGSWTEASAPIFASDVNDSGIFT